MQRNSTAIMGDEFQSLVMTTSTLIDDFRYVKVDLYVKTRCSNCKSIMSAAFAFGLGTLRPEQFPWWNYLGHRALTGAFKRQRIYQTKVATKWPTIKNAAVP